MRTAIAAISLIICLLCIWTVGQAGLSRLLVSYKKDVSLYPSTNTAVRLSPSDAEAHYVRAVVLWRMGRIDEAVKEYENAVALRPRDHALWLILGTARDKNDDEEGALAAYRQAARLAPRYAQPPWEIGNLLLRMNRRDEGVAELRRSAESDPVLLPRVINLVWEAFDGDAQAVQQAIRPQNARARLVLARFFAGQGSATEAIKLFREAGGAADKDRRAFLAELLAAKRFPESYEVWSSGREPGSGGVAVINDGSFEGRIARDDPGFGWQLARDMQWVKISLNTNEPRSGARSLLLEFSGNSNPASPVISQLVLVEPHTRYRLTFAARTEEIVTGGLPLVIVVDASNEDRALAQSSPLPQGTSGWQDYAMDFATSSTTSAVLIRIQRQHCASAPCPIFGRAWFDSFSLRKL